MSDQFLTETPTLADQWRGIVLFGRNVASYKFALAKSLLELKPQGGDLVELADLAPVFSGHIAEHLQHSDKQATSKSSKFLDACRKYNTGEISKDELVAQTVRSGFNNVIDAFHVVGRGPVPDSFYIDERKTHNGIRITDEFSKLLDQTPASALPNEVEARWRLVETAWDLGVSRSTIAVNYDHEHESLFAVDRKQRRKNITSTRDALNGYQKGSCFYCHGAISLKQNSDEFPDVDHFFPHRLKFAECTFNVDGVWNLVLACQGCNRGRNGKFDSVPSIRLLQLLHKRNEYLIGSHHPLRETLIGQTGNSTEKRISFLNDAHQCARRVLLHLWDPD